MAKAPSSDMILPVQPVSLAQSVVDRLLQYVRMAGLKPGDSLPGEIELAQRLGVSRSVVREAISRMRSLGLVNTRRYRGLVLCEPDVLVGLERVLDTPLVTTRMERDLLELRVVLEMGAIDLFWRRKTDQDVEHLAELAPKVDATDPLSKTRRQGEEAFHGLILEVAGNDVLSRFGSLLRRAFEAEAPLHDAFVRFRPKDMPDHRRLVKAIRSGSLEQFRTAMWNHVRAYIDAIDAEREV
jgi:DNA-binding FadR family transcriptional regulator